MASFLFQTIVKKRSFIGTFLALCAGSSLVINACTEKKQENKKDSESVKVQPTTTPNASRAPSTVPTGNNSTQPQAGTPAPVPNEAKSAPVVPVTLELFSQIKEGQHSGVTYADRTRLLTKEAQRCRVNNASLVKQGAVYPGINPNQNPDQIISSYRAKHHFPNFADPCRQELGLTGSFGHFMRLENLIALENCSRGVEIQKQPNLDVRSVAREVLLMENLTLLCRLSDESLTPLVQSALSAAFVGTWVDLGK